MRTVYSPQRAKPYRCLFTALRSKSFSLGFGWAALVVAVHCSGWLSPPLSAQVHTAALSGTVSDETGAFVPGVTITITHTGTGVTRTVVTDDQGRYHAPALSVGQYEVRAELAGFKTAIQKGVLLTVGRETVVNFTLVIGEISEQVVVTGESSLIETSSAAITGLVEEKRILDLPLNGRSFEQLATLELGVNFARGAGKSEEAGRTNQVSIVGSRPFYNSYLLDGSNVSNAMGTTPGGRGGQFLGVETVKEFRVETTTYGAEFGNSAGGVINIATKSGSNEFHGSVFEFLRNDNLDASNFFDTEGKPEFKRNQFGFSLGGTIVKNKTFFFGAYEGLREDLGLTQIAVVPDENARLGILPDPVTKAPTFVGFDQNIKPYLDLWPLPTPGGKNFGDGTAERIKTASQPAAEDFFQVRIDHNFSTNDAFFARYTFSDSETVRPEDIPEYSPSEDGRNQYATVEWRRIVTNNFLNTTRFGFSRVFAVATMHFDVNVPESLNVVAGQPFLTSGNLDIGSGVSALSANSRGFPVVQALNTEEVSNDSNYTLGAHSLKWGINVKWIQLNNFEGRRNSGEVSFAGIRDFFANRAERFRALIPGIGDRHRSWRQQYYGFYVQDNIKLHPRLAFNAGLRYEFMSNPDEKYGRCVNLDHLLDPAPRFKCPFFPENPTLRNFGPRLGLAWDPSGDGKTSVRAGFGIFHDNISPKEYQTAGGSQAPLASVVSIRRPREPVLVPGQPFLSRVSIPDPPLDFRPIRVNGTPYTIQYSLFFQRELLRDLVLNLGYAGNNGVHLARTVEENVTVPQFLPDGSFFFPRGNPPFNPRIGESRATMYDGTSGYHALLFGIQKRFTGGFQVQSSYTWSRALDNASSITGNFEAKSTLPDATNPFNRSLDKGLSSFHIEHNYVLNFSFDLPIGQGKRWGNQLSPPLEALLGGWQVHTIWTLASGSPFTVAVGFNRSNSRTNDTVDRPDLLPGRSNNPVLKQPHKWYDDTAFELQREGFLGNLGKNTVIGPDYNNFDFSLTKRNNLTEGLTLQFRAEFFNLSNRPNFSLPDRDTIFTRAGIRVGSAGLIRETVTSSRQVQFGLKLVF